MVRVLWWILEMLGLQSLRHQDIHWISKVSACQLKPVTPWCPNPTSSEFASLRVSKTCWGHQPLRIPQAVFWHQNLEILVRLWNNKWDLDDEYTGRFVFSWTTIQSQKCDFETNNARSGILKPGIFSNSSLWTSWSERESLKNKSLASSFLSQSSVFLQAEENGFPNQLTSCKSPFPFLKMTR